MLRFSATVALLVTLAACTVPQTTRPPAGAPAPVAQQAPRSGPLPEASLYQVEATWQDQAGHTRQLRDLRGRPQLVAMVYTGCAHACPTTVMDMKRVLAALDAATREQVGLVLVSLDPAHDSPQALAAFAGKFALDPGQWTLLNGTAPDVRTMAALLGVRYAPNEDGSVSHTNRLTVLDREGGLLHQQDGLGGDVSEIVSALGHAL